MPFPFLLLGYALRTCHWKSVKLVFKIHIWKQKHIHCTKQLCSSKKIYCPSKNPFSLRFWCLQFADILTLAYPCDLSIVKLISLWSYSDSHNFMVMSFVFIPCNSLMKENYTYFQFASLRREYTPLCPVPWPLLASIYCFPHWVYKMKWACLVLLLSNVIQSTLGFVLPELLFILLGLLDRHLYCTCWSK